MAREDKVVTNQLRKIADRQGFKLEKSRAKDPHAVEFGKFALTDVRTGRVINEPIAGRWKFSWTIEEVRKYLRRPVQ